MVRRLSTVSIPYRFNETKELTIYCHAILHVSIPYRFNETFDGLTGKLIKDRFQFLIGSMRQQVS